MDPLYEDPIQYVQHWEPKAKDLEQAACDVRLEKIFDPDVRCKILDMYVDMGREGIQLAQRCVGAKEDGGVGPHTLTLWNSCAPGDLLWKLANVSMTYYNVHQGDENAELRARALGRIDQHMPLGLTDSLKEKIHEQISFLKQHGRRSGPRPSTEGQGTQRSGVDKGKKS